MQVSLVELVFNFLIDYLRFMTKSQITAGWKLDFFLHGYSWVIWYICVEISAKNVLHHFVFFKLNCYHVIGEKNTKVVISNFQKYAILILEFWNLRDSHSIADLQEKKKQTLIFYKMPKSGVSYCNVKNRILVLVKIFGKKISKVTI